jgi:hypothetical protein
MNNNNTKQNNNFTLSEHAQTNDNSNEVDELDELENIDNSDSSSENYIESLDEQSENSVESQNSNDNFNEFALKHLSELLINLLTLDDKNSIVHNNTNFLTLVEKLDDINNNQKLILKTIEENTKVNKVVMKLLEKAITNYGDKVCGVKLI